MKTVVIELRCYHQPEEGAPALCAEVQAAGGRAGGRGSSDGRGRKKAAGHAAFRARLPTLERCLELPGAERGMVYTVGLGAAQLARGVRVPGSSQTVAKPGWQPRVLLGGGEGGGAGTREPLPKAMHTCVGFVQQQQQQQHVEEKTRASMRGEGGRAGGRSDIQGR